MEIVEIISYYINHASSTLDVKFRLSDDSESEIRKDEVDLGEISDFGFNVITEDFEFYDEDDDEITGINEEINEEELLSFLNEYYLIYPERLPLKELY